jgi:hypothetical protein
MVQRERVEQDDRGPIALHGVEDICVVAPEPHIRNFTPVEEADSPGATPAARNRRDQARWA